MAKKAKGGVNKSAEVRALLDKDPNAKPREVSAALKARGIDVSAQYVSTIKGNYGGGKSNRKGRKKKAARKKTARTRAGAPKGSAAVTAADLKQAKGLADKLGGIAAAQRALDTLSELQ